MDEGQAIPIPLSLFIGSWDSYWLSNLAAQKLLGVQ
jgi:hypothetical protein